MKWVSSKEVKRITGVTNQTLYNWRKERKVKFKKIGYRTVLYDLDSILDLKNEKFNAIYCRVSTTKQKDDLIKQEQILKEWCVKNGYKIDYIFKDIASGMNENRKGLKELIDLVVTGKIKRVFITYKDRLTRFGFDYFKLFFSYFDTEIVVLNATDETTFENELVQDLISIIHHFSMKMYSHRREQLKKIQKEIEEINDNN